MKKNLFPLLAIVVLLVAIYSVYHRRSSTVREELKDFAVKDTARISQIFLSDRSGNSIKLKRISERNWRVNDSIEAKHESMRLLLEVIYRVNVKNRVFRNSYNTIINDLASRGIKCEIYFDGHEQPEKVYYVGGPTPDATGTYMMLENSAMPFVTEIPGFNGYLTPWYPTAIDHWKDNVVFTYAPQDIRRIAIDYPGLPARSFKLERQGNNFVLSSPLKPGTTMIGDTLALSNFLSRFHYVPFESIDKINKEHYKDSISSTQALVNYVVTDTKGEDRRIRIYPMPLNDFSLTREDSLGNPLKYDVDRMLAWLESERQWVTIQHFTFDPILRSFQDFAVLGKQSTTAPQRRP